MPIYKGKTNPLDLYNCREYNYPAKHLDYIFIDNMSYNLETAIRVWIKDNLSGRYYISKEHSLEEERKAIIKIGFEKPAESSYFQIACPLLKY